MQNFIPPDLTNATANMFPPKRHQKGVHLLTFCVLIGVAAVQGADPREINPGGKCNQLKCETTDTNGVRMRYMSGHTIDNHTIVDRTPHSEIDGNEQECVKECISVATCITVVVVLNETKCRLYEGDDVYASPHTIVPMPFTKIISLGNAACKHQACNNGKCVPNFDGSGNFTCSCDPGYSGERCERQGFDLHFTFDEGTDHSNTMMSDVKMTLDQGQIVGVADRRGKVLMVSDGRNAVKMEAAQENLIKYGSWMSNPWIGKNNLTVALWVKMVPTESERNKWVSILTLTRWRLRYKEERRSLKVWNAIKDVDEPVGKPNALSIECEMKNKLNRWTHIVVAMGGSAGKLKLYVDGELCKSNGNSDTVEPNAEAAWKPDDKLIFVSNQGVSMIDELIFHNLFFDDKEKVRRDYIREKNKFMG